MYCQQKAAERKLFENLFNVNKFTKSYSVVASMLFIFIFHSLDRKKVAHRSRERRTTAANETQP